MTTRHEDVRDARDPRAGAEELCMDLSRPIDIIDRELQARWPRIVGMWWEIEPDGQSGWVYRGDNRILAKLVHVPAFEPILFAEFVAEMHDVIREARQANATDAAGRNIALYYGDMMRRLEDAVDLVNQRLAVKPRQGAR